MAASEDRTDRELKSLIRSRLRNWKDRFISCPACHEEMALEEYRSTHSRSRHGMDEKVTCIFCRDFTFLGSHEDVVHKDACSRQFMSRHTVDPAIAAKRCKMRKKISFWNDNNMHCPHCDEEMTFATYQSHHAKEIHGLNCVYCTDAQPHDPLDCFFEFIEVIKRRKRSTVPPEQVENGPEQVENLCEPQDIPLCDCVDFKTWHHRHQMDGRDYDESYPSIYEDYPGDFPELKNPGFVPVFSEESGLGHEASAMFRMYFSGEWTFYHVYVRAYAYRLFQRRMPESLVVSHFWCLCDGGDGVTPLHRHMIVATRNVPEFLAAMKRVRLQGLKPKGKRFITSGLHLANAIHYVSDQKSICKNRDTRRKPTRDGHFYINRPLHEHAVKDMCTSWPGGMKMWIDQKNRVKSITGWNLEKTRSRNTKFLARILETMPEIKHCPVQLRYEPDLAAAVAPWLGYSMHPDPEGHFPLYWFEGDTMRVGSVRDEFPDYRHFMQHQVDSGNSLRTRMQDKWYTLNKMQVAQANVAEHVRAQMNAEIVALRCDLEDQRAALAERDCQIQELEAALREETFREDSETFREELEAALAEMRRLRDIEMDHMFEIAELRRENADLCQRRTMLLEALHEIYMM